MPYRRDFFCRRCGKLKRADSPYARPTVLELGSGLARREPEPGEQRPVRPACCGDEMRLLRYEEAVAAKQLDASRRVAWYRAGAHYARRGGKRPWRPVMDAARCYGCHRGKEI